MVWPIRAFLKSRSSQNFSVCCQEFFPLLVRMRRSCDIRRICQDFLKISLSSVQYISLKANFSFVVV